MPLQSYGIAAVANQTKVLLLIVPPLAEVIFGGSNSQSQQKKKAHYAEGQDWIAKQSPPEGDEFSFHGLHSSSPWQYP